MDLLGIVCLVLVVYCLTREIFFIYSVNKLINKLMARNYYDYMVSQGTKKSMEQERKSQYQGAEKEIEQKVQEDLSYIDDIRY